MQNKKPSVGGVWIFSGTAVTRQTVVRHHFGYKAVAQHLNLPNHSHKPFVACGVSLHQGNTESHKKFRAKIYLPNQHS